tara:strand:- start:487 stop:957 length:471 start_codon:yes stop_codon:yes gene_type:complete
MRLSIVSGGFDPVHVGHLELFERAKSMADKLYVIVNSDQFLKSKKGKPFMKFKERCTIIEALKPVDRVIGSVDVDNTVCKTLEWVHRMYKGKYSEIAFCNGGDRTIDAEKPEHKICLDLGIEPIYGLGDKIQSSSWLTDEKKVSQSYQSDAGSLFF